MSAVWLPWQVATIADTIRTTPATIAGRGETALRFAKMFGRSHTGEPFNPIAFLRACGLSDQDSLTYVRFVNER